MEEIVNKVAASGLITIDLQAYLPADEELAVFDIKPYLFQEMILREKDFRAALKEIDWESYHDKYVAVTCSVDAIVPMWAYMLLATKLEPVTKLLMVGDLELLKKEVLKRHIDAIDDEAYRDKRLVIKGCGDKSVPADGFLEITRKFRPLVKSIMYGEPCSSVPIYKKKV